MKTNRQGTVTSTQRVAIILRKARVRQRSPGSVVTMIKQFFFLRLAQGKNDKIISTCTHIIVINTSTENILPLDNTILCTITYIACGLPQTLQPPCQSYLPWKSTQNTNVWRQLRVNYQDGYVGGIPLTPMAWLHRTSQPGSQNGVSGRSLMCRGVWSSSVNRALSGGNSNGRQSPMPQT